MMTVGERISIKMKEKKISQNKLAKAAQISQSGLSSIINGASSPKENTLQSIAAALNCSVSDLLGEELPSGFLHMMRNAVPIIGEIACGDPITAEENIEGQADLPDGIRADFALRCKGTSMEPTFRDGDLVLIRQQEEVPDGKIAAVLIGSEATLKRVHRIPDGVMLIPDNSKDFSPLIYQREAAAEIRIIGLAVGYVRMI